MGNAPSLQEHWGCKSLHNWGVGRRAAGSAGAEPGLWLNVFAISSPSTVGDGQERPSPPLALGTPTSHTQSRGEGHMPEGLGPMEGLQGSRGLEGLGVGGPAGLRDGVLEGLGVAS